VVRYNRLGTGQWQWADGGSSRERADSCIMHQPGTSYPTPKHKDPIHPIPIHESAYKGGY
jgi:hypothetical protein